MRSTIRDILAAGQRVRGVFDIAGNEMDANLLIEPLPAELGALIPALGSSRLSPV